VRVYAIGDIHGRADLLALLFAAIDADIAARPVKRALHVLIGDYVDRGPSSREVVDLILKRRAFHELVALKGNHDIYPLKLIQRPETYDEWRALGGIETLMSYGLRPTLRMAGNESHELADLFRAALPPNHFDFFTQLKPSFSIGDFLFAHAGVRPGVPLDRQSEDDLLWIREEFLAYEANFGKVIVHGHTPVRKIECHPNRINIDTGAYATGRLSALVIEGSDLKMLQTGNKASGGLHRIT
jgi:serine/threonine protein phosphatase 1